MAEDEKNGTAAALVGVWRAGLGTAAALTSDFLEFRADGGGRAEIWTVGRGRERIDFVWRPAGPAEIAIRESDDDEWSTVAWSVRRVATDIGAQEVLCEPKRDGFWLFAYPLRRSKA